ncbi:hypothetical protein D9757_013243 [Collybiopsis confluens]|uniref:(2E,6E)-farnesyl diphosphate synthase n=1 Tax=Collybiopsis confluens TaxID=2823264 RepID=A0A8H5FWP1_9AGAR|nr:hypothetical protein D9757_013243 [Collybiopsis confluens]
MKRKEILRHMANAFNEWMKVDTELLEVIIRIAHAVQNDSLLFDDIEDGSELRRGRPVANTVYGVPQTVNAASYVVIKIYKDALELRGLMAKKDLINRGKPMPEEIITEELLNAHRGQGLDILWRDKVECPTEDEYIDMIKNSVMYQIRDDLSNLRDATLVNELELLRFFLSFFYSHSMREIWPRIGSEANCLMFSVNMLDGLGGPDVTENSDVVDSLTSYGETKGFAEDLTEGKFSFPLVHAIHADQSNSELLDIIRQRPKTPTLKKRALEYMEHRTKSFEYTMDVLGMLWRRIEEEVKVLGGNAKLEVLIDRLRVK